MTILANALKGWRRVRATAPDAASEGTDRAPENLRARFARRLSGAGVEIGALASPLWLPPGARARYVDKFDYDKLCAHNP
ncbi:MAG: hypothetical protein AB1689_03625, partial [Thermodesulfobacteriota bacterium]